LSSIIPEKQKPCLLSQAGFENLGKICFLHLLALSALIPFSRQRRIESQRAAEHKAGYNRASILRPRDGNRRRSGRRNVHASVHQMRDRFMPIRYSRQ
jgi:hypothetical protein